MNQGNPQQGAQPGQGQQQQARPVLLRPEQIRNNSFLLPEERGKYEKGLQGLWDTFNKTQPGTPEYFQVQKRITDFSTAMTSKIRGRQMQRQQQQQNAQQPGPQPGQQQQQQQPQQQPPQQPPQQGGQAANAGAAGQAAPGAGSSNNAPGQQGAAGAQGGGGSRIPEHIAKHIAQMTFPQPPANIAPENQAGWFQTIKARYVRALMQMESTKSNVARLEQSLKERREKGPPLTPEEEKQYQEKKTHYLRAHTDASNFANQIRKANENERQGAGNQGPGNQQARAGGAGGAGQPAQGPGMQNSNNPTAAVNAAIEAAKNQQMAATRLPGANGNPGQQQPQANQSATTQASPVATSQPTSMAPQQPKVEPQSHPVPPPVNTALASAAAAGGLPSAGTPPASSARLHTPQAATPTSAMPGPQAGQQLPPQQQQQAGQPGAPRPLTHHAAIAKANQNQANPSPAAPAPSGGTPSVASAGVMGSTIQQHQHQSAHPHAHPPTQPAQTVQTKMPIPKSLPEKATAVPTPVAMTGGAGAGRPTYSGGMGTAGGVMSQPAMQKAPAFVFETEGERVLKKSKLGELVRQVCGGTAEGHEGNMLSPEVEESILNLADSFTDNVLHAACRNAKERGSKVLEVRDIQLVLERTYNIRIPGYSSDELRTVRKIQPAPGWIAKMSAVQAAKVMPGKGDL